MLEIYKNKKFKKRYVQTKVEIWIEYTNKYWNIYSKNLIIIMWWHSKYNLYFVMILVRIYKYFESYCLRYICDFNQI